MVTRAHHRRNRGTATYAPICYQSTRHARAVGARVARPAQAPRARPLRATFSNDADGLVATASSECTSMRAVLPRPPIATIANGVICQPTVPNRNHRDVLTDRTLLFMSRIHPKKNLVGLIDAFAQIAARAEFANWRLVIAGPDEGGHGAHLTARILKYELNGRISMPGSVGEDEKSSIFAAADLFILPTFSENFGIVVAEALAAGVPVITTTGTPWQDLAIRGCGWQVSPDSASLAEAMALAMRLSAPERRQMGIRGHAYVRDTFGWDLIAEQMLGFYDWLLHAGTPPPFINCPAP